MKHFTSFATTLLLWLCAAVAWADVSVGSSATAPTDVTEGYYLLKAKFSGKIYYVYHDSSNDKPFRIKEEASVDLTTLANNLQYVWYVTKNSNNQFIIQNASSAAYFPADAARNRNFQFSSAIGNAAILEAETPSGIDLENGCLLKQVQNKNENNSLYIHANRPGGDPNLSYWDTNKVGANETTVQLSFVKVDGLTSAVVTPAYAAYYKIKKNGEVISNTWSVGLKGSNIFPTLNKSYYYSLQNSDQATYGPNSGNVEQNYVGTAPVGVTFSTPENPTWFKIKFRGNDGNYAIYSNGQVSTGGWKDHTQGYGIKFQDTYDELNGAYWALVEDGLGVKLYNRAAKKYVTQNGENNTKATLTDQGTTFYMETTNQSGAQFSLRYGSNKSFLGDHVSNYLGTWRDDKANCQNDGGSAYTLIAVDNTDIELALSYIKLSSEASTDDALTMNDPNAATTAITKLKSASTLEEIDAAISNVNLEMKPDPNAYYRIRNVNTDLTNRYLSSENILTSTEGSLAGYYTAHNDMDRKVTRKSDNDNFGSQIWTFTQNSDGTYTMVNANTQREFGELQDGGVEMPINIGYGNGHYNIKPYTSSTPFDGYNANSMFVVYDVNGNQLGAKNGNEDAYVCTNNNQYTNKSNYWQLVKVTSVPVTIKSVGWASVAFPFAVKVPTESGVKAYIAETAEGSVMKLKEIEDGIIPANTGALLAKDGGTIVNLELTTTETTYPENKLQYTTAERKGYDTNTIVNYLLSAKSGTVGFLPSKLDFVPSNKAFLPATNITATTADAQMLTFNFGEITGISHATTNPSTEAEVYYDLNGRRVLYPSNGIFVTAQGKKIFIK